MYPAFRQVRRQQRPSMLGSRGEKNEQEGPLQRTTAGASPKEGKDGPDRMAKEPVRASPDRLCPVTTGGVSWRLSIYLDRSGNNSRQ